MFVWHFCYAFNTSLFYELAFELFVIFAGVILYRSCNFFMCNSLFCYNVLQLKVVNLL